MEPRFPLDRYIKGLIFSQNKESSNFIQIKEKKNFSLLLREKFSRAVALVVIKAPTRQVHIKPES